MAALFRRGVGLASYDSAHALTLSTELPFVLSSAESEAADRVDPAGEPPVDHRDLIEALEAALARSGSRGEFSADIQAVAALCRTLLGVNQARRSLNALQGSEAALVALIEKLIAKEAPRASGEAARRGSSLPLMLGPSSDEAIETPAPSDAAERVFTGQVHVRLLGRFDVEIEGTPLPAWRSRRARQLFQYLLLNHREEISRHRLMGLFWPEHSEERAENNLSLTVMTLRRVLDQTASGTGAWVAFHSGSYHLRPRNLWLDIDAFDEAIERGKGLEKAGNATGAAAAFDVAIALYGGELLPSEVYEDWTVSRRQRLQDGYLEALQRRAAMGRLAGDYELSIRLNQRVLDTDPALEAVHRQLILDYLETGQRSRAVQQIEACREALRRHLGEEPDRESLALFARVAA